MESASGIDGSVTPVPEIDAAGWLTGVPRIPSPNCDERPAGCAIELIVIHAISLPPGEFGGAAIEALFTNRLDCASHPYYAALAGLEVSAHFLIRRGGELVQFVPCGKRAWHAGVSSWRGRAACNDFSIGIELEGADVAFEDAQYATLGALARALSARYPIAESVGHSTIAPGRKTDPGPHFDWARYRRSVKSNRQGATTPRKTKVSARMPRRMRISRVARKGKRRKR